MFKVRENLTGRVFGLLTVKEYSHSLKKRAIWTCICKCGKEIKGKAIYLKRGALVSCGCRNKIDYLNKIIEDIKVESYHSCIEHNGENKYLWNCICKCGVKRILSSKQLSEKRLTKCSVYCLTPEQKKIRLHEIRLWHNGKRRCLKRSIEGSFSLKDFEELCQKYNGKCLCCGSNKERLCADHIIPISKGGTNYIDNIQPLCKSCNSKKRVKTTDYRPKEN